MANQLPLNTSYNQATVGQRAAQVLKAPGTYLKSAKPIDVSKFKNIPAALPEKTVAGVQFEKSVPSLNIQENYPGYTFDPNYVKQQPVSAKFATLSKFVGGGQYAYDPTNPSAYLKSERRFETPEQQIEKNILLGGRSSSLYQVDHIYPIWLEGSDTLENKQVLNIFDHDKKTKVGEVARALYTAGKISKNEATALSLNWQDKDVAGVNLDQKETIKDKFGNEQIILPTKIAEEYKKKWETVTPTGIKDAITGIPEAFKKTWTSFKADAAKSLDIIMPPMTSAFTKGVLSGMTFGYFDLPAAAPKPGTVEAQWEKTANSVANVTGHVAGAIASFKAVEGLLLNGFKYVASARKIPLVTSGATKLAKIMEYESKPALAAKYVQPKGTSTAVPIIAKMLAPGLKGYGKTAAKNALIFNTVGQLSKQDEEGSRARRVFTDTSMALSLSGLPMSVKGAFGAAFAGMMIEYINSGDVDNALLSGAIMGGLHGVGVATQAKGSIATDAEKIATDSVLGQRNLWLGRAKIRATEPPPIGSALEQRMKYGSDLMNDNVRAQSEIIKAYHNGEIDEVKMNQEIGKLIAGSRWLENIAVANTSPKIDRVIALDAESKVNWEQLNKDNGIDLPTHRIKLVPDAGVRFIEGNKDLFDIGERKMPLITAESDPVAFKNASEKKFVGAKDNYINAEGNTVRPSYLQITSQGKDGIIKDNQIKFASDFVYDPNNPQYGFLVDNPEITYAVKQAGKLAGESAEKHLALVAYKNGEFLNLGYAPSKTNIAEQMNQKQLSVAAKRNLPAELYDSDVNKDTIYDSMKQNGISARIVQISFAEAKNVESGLPAIVIKMGTDTLGNNMDAQSVLRNIGISSKEAITVDRILDTMKAIRQAKQLELSLPEIKKPESRVLSYKPVTEKDLTREVRQMMKEKKAAGQMDMLSSIYNKTENTINPGKPVRDKIINVSAEEKTQRVSDAANNAVKTFTTPTKSAVKPSVTIAPKQETVQQSPQIAPQAKPKEAVVEEMKTLLASRPTQTTPQTAPKVTAPATENKFYDTKQLDLFSTAEPKVELAMKNPQPAPATEKVNIRDFRRFDEKGVIKGLSDDIDKKLSEVKATPEQIKVAEGIKKSLSAEEMYVKSKELVNKYNGNEDHAFNEFINSVESNYQKLGIDTPITGRKSKAALKSLFKRTAQSVPDKAILVTPTKTSVIERTPQPASFIDESLAQFNKERGTDLDVMKVQVDSKMRKKMSISDLKNKLYEAGYVPFGATGNSADTLFGIKYDPIIGGSKNIKEGTDKFFDFIISNVLNLSKTDDKAVLNKRWKEFNFAEFKPINDSNVKKRLIVINFGKDANKHEIVDGASFVHTDDMIRINKEGGYLHKPEEYLTNKNVITFKGEDGKPNIIKNELFGVKPDSATAERIEEYVRQYIPNYKFQPGDYITSHNNVKISTKILENFGEGKPNYYVGEFPMSAFRAKYELPKMPDQDYKFSPYLNSKFGYADGLNKVVEEMYSQPVERFKKAFTELVYGSKTAKEARAVLSEYQDIFKTALGENMYGKTKKILENGGWGKNGSDIRYELELALHNSLRDYVLNGQFLKAHYGKFYPDFGVIKSPNGKWAEVPEDSIMLSNKTIEKLGNPEVVLATRHPNTKRTGLLPFKVISAEERGITDLGESMIVNNKVGYREFYFDTDGDAGPLFAVGKSEGGNFKIPEEYANKLKGIFEREGGKEAPTLTNYEKGPITFENSMDLAEKAVKGGQSVGENSTFRRVIQGIMDNDESIGGWKLKKPAQGETLEQRNQKLYAFTEYMSNASTDAVKKSNLDKELSNGGVSKLSDLLRNKFFDAPKGVPHNIAAKNFFDSLSERQAIYDYADSSKGFSQDRYNEMKNAFAVYWKNIGSKRQKPGPVDVIAKLVSNLPEFPERLSAKEQQFTHDARVNNVKKYFADNNIQRAPISDPVVKDYLSFFSKKKDEGSKEIMSVKQDNKAAIKKIKDGVKDEVTDYYYSVAPNMTEEQKRTIAVWLLTAKKSNLSNWGGYEDSHTSFQVRLSFIFNDTPEVAKPYYEANPI